MAHMKKYFPIVLSKAGELGALNRLTPTVKSEISPVFQVLSKSRDKFERHLVQQWSFNNNQVLLDFNNHENLNAADVMRFYHRLFDQGINVVPVVQANSSNDYIQFVNNAINNFDCKVCFKISNNSGGLYTYSQQISDLVRQINTNPENTLLLIDLGYVEHHNYNNYSAIAIQIIQNVISDNWAEIIVASGSFPEDLGNMAANVVHRLQRYEWDVWKNIVQTNGLGNIKYSDYGTKNPIYAEVPYAGTCSIKYSTNGHFVIYKGVKSGNHRLGNGQYIVFSDQLIKTPDYYGAPFSWGDEEINRIAQEPLTGNRHPGGGKEWVAISQNHHLSLIHSLV